MKGLMRGLSDCTLHEMSKKKDVWPLGRTVPQTEITMDIRVAGVSYRQQQVKLCQLGDDVLLEPEPTNPADPNAVKVLVRNSMIGYIPAYAAKTIGHWLEERRVRAVKITGIRNPNEVKDNSLQGSNREKSNFIGVSISLQVAPIPGEEEAKI